MAERKPEAATTGRLFSHLRFSSEISGMASERIAPSRIAAQIQQVLRDGGSAEHASGVQWFFKDKIKSHGWYTGDLRRAVRRCRREILRQHDFSFLVEVADELFCGQVLEEKVANC
jgi:hypothetical protein